MKTANIFLGFLLALFFLGAFVFVSYWQSYKEQQEKEAAKERIREQYGNDVIID